MKRSEGEQAQSIGFLLHVASSTMRERMVDALQDSGLHLGHLAILECLLHGGANQRRIGARTRIEKSSIVIFIDALEAMGLVARRRDPADRRAYVVELTPNGGALIEKLAPRLLRAEEAALARLDAHERDDLQHLLTKMVGGAEQRPPAPPPA